MEADYRVNAQQVYRSARKLGLKYMAERHGAGESGLLAALDQQRRETCSELPLGLAAIPLEKIKGTYAIGRQSAFSGNFMPILEDGTEFSAKWQSLYRFHVGEGIREPIKVYEYLGYYYVIEGNKRVSVLIYSGAYSIEAEIIRLLPAFDEKNPQIAIFYELIGEDKRALIGHMWFSQPERMTSLRAFQLKAAKKNPGWPEDFLASSFFNFRTSFHKLGYRSLPLTTGDAFLEYVKIYGFPFNIGEDELAENIKNCLPQFGRVGAQIKQTVISSPSDLSEMLAKRPVISQLLSGRQKLSLAFAYYGGADSSFTARAHEAGRRLLAARYPGIEINVLAGLPGGRAGYSDMAALVEAHRPDVLFSTDPLLAPAALRVALESKDTTVLQCQPPEKESFLSTYYAKTEEPLFLCGVIAGALTRTGSVAVIKGRSALGLLPASYQAFAQGAKTVRPSVRVYYAEPADRSLAGRGAAQKNLAEKGCDMVWLPYMPGAPGQRKSFPGVTGYLCSLDPLGSILRYYVCAAWHWEAFYVGLAEMLADPSVELPGGRSGYRFHMGLPSGVLGVHPIYPLQPWPRRLLSNFEALLSAGEVKPVDENMTVEIFGD